MPELPEMENYRQLLSTLIEGKQIKEIEINREKSIDVPVNVFLKEVKGSSITRIERRAKHLLFYLNTGKILILHLMLGGWLFYGTEEEKPKRTVQIKLTFENNKHLYFIGLRLGYLHLLTEDKVNEKLKDLGPEPLVNDFTLEKFTNMISIKRGMLKTTFVDQHFISGIGNCYSDEICFDASVKPIRKGNELKAHEINQLYHSIRQVLSTAIAYGGYMENPLFNEDNLTGGYDPKCKVYDREEEPCLRCGNPIIKDEISSRKTFYCNICQQ